MDTVKVFNNDSLSQKDCIELITEKLTNTIPFLNVYSGCLGTDTIMLLVSFEPKNEWIYGYFGNSNNYYMSFKENGEIKVFSQSLYYNGVKSYETRLKVKFRKCHVKTIDKFFKKVNDYNEMVKEELKKQV